MAQIEFKNISVGYGSHKVLDNISFKINKGEYICVVGENGSGKSTLVKTLLGLIPPLSGTVLQDKETDKNRIGYLPQQNLAQKDFPASCKEIVMSGFINKFGFRAFYNKEEKNKAREIMENLGISDLENKGFKELSGGQQQRVLLARALCAADKIILLDEPSAGLDSKISVKMYEIFRTINKNGTTIIMVTHDIDDVINDATHVLRVENGKTIWQSKDEYVLNFMNEKI